MESRARAAALLPVWAVITAAGIGSTLAFTAVQGSRAGCLGPGVADLVSILGIAGLSFGVSALVLVGAVPRYRSIPAACGAAASLAVSLYAVVTFLAQDGAVCPV